MKLIKGYEKLLFHKVQAYLKEKAATLPSFAVQKDTPVKKLVKDGEINMRVQVLRKRVRSLEDGSETIIYTSDPKAISKFFKRKKA